MVGITGYSSFKLVKQIIEHDVDCIRIVEIPVWLSFGQVGKKCAVKLLAQLNKLNVSQPRPASNLAK